MKKIIIPKTVPRSKHREYLKNFKIATQGTGKMMMFAGDQRVEHLNDDFVGPGIPKEVADPKHFFEIAKEAHIGVFATQVGLMSRYSDICPKIPLIVKVNSKTNLVETSVRDPFSNRWLSMEDIIEFKKNSGLNIVGVGYTVYIGSAFEADSFGQAARICYKAHQEGLITVLWMYPRGKTIKNESDIHLLAGAAGVGLCVGADFIKINYPYKLHSKKTAEKYKEVVTAAGRSGVICVGGHKKDDKGFLEMLHSQINVSGTKGCAVGRNIYQRPVDQAIRMADAISAVTLHGYSVKDAYQILKGKKKLKAKKC
ncbi:aldolase [Candidatus Falkowbacteria bacterium]|nr:aldolase [Candidatus Falkowbacteria bacterium]